jgi:hypothetical protein
MDLCMLHWFWSEGTTRATASSQVLDCLQDLWCTQTKGWSPHTLAMLDSMLAPAMWSQSHSSISTSSVSEETSFPPRTAPIITNFIELEQEHQQPSSTFKLLIAVIVVLYPKGRG